MANWNQCRSHWKGLIKTYIAPGTLPLAVDTPLNSSSLSSCWSGAVKEIFFFLWINFQKLRKRSFVQLTGQKLMTKYFLGKYLSQSLIVLYVFLKETHMHNKTVHYYHFLYAVTQVFVWFIWTSLKITWTLRNKLLWWCFHSLSSRNIS